MGTGARWLSYFILFFIIFFINVLIHASVLKCQITLADSMSVIKCEHFGKKNYKQVSEGISSGPM